MNTWFKVDYHNRITEVRVIRETKEYLMVPGYGRNPEVRIAKKSSGECYFPTAEAAVAHIQKEVASELESAKMYYERMQARWDAVKDGTTIPVERLKEQAR